MHSASEPVFSRQTEPHPRLEETVRKHALHPWLRPVAEHSSRVFESCAAVVGAWRGPLILDSGCGTGMSTGVLARRFPDCLVLGVDKSDARLGRSQLTEPNARLFRMDLEDFWLLAHGAGWKFERQCFFYPNPWPKPEQRQRRWAFHPVLPTALACGGVWELRTNWLVYAQEFAKAYEILTGVSAPVEAWTPDTPETLFEKKYGDSGHSLWRWISGRTPTEARPQLH